MEKEMKETYSKLNAQNKNIINLLANAIEVTQENTVKESEEK